MSRFRFVTFLYINPNTLDRLTAGEVRVPQKRIFINHPHKTGRLP